jgi:ElaB/YqjD/DUF883 family membrane-anchored ribosome-binding protein
MSNSPDEIRRDIEQTRRELASDVDVLHEKVSPSAVAGRKVESAKGAVTGLKDKVMGATSSSGDAVSSAGSSVTDAASSAPSAVRSQTQGNPLAAGVIAFGAGWLLSSLLPASEKEKQVATQVKDKASEHSDTFTEPAKQAAQDVKENLKAPVQEAADSVRSTATDAAGTVQDSASRAKDEVAGQARDAKDHVQGNGSTDLGRPVGTAPGGSTY